MRPHGIHLPGHTSRQRQACRDADTYAPRPSERVSEQKRGTAEGVGRVPGRWGEIYKWCPPPLSNLGNFLRSNMVFIRKKWGALLCSTKVLGWVHHVTVIPSLVIHSHGSTLQHQPLACSPLRAQPFDLSSFCTQLQNHVFAHLFIHCDKQAIHCKLKEFRSKFHSQTSHPYHIRLHFFWNTSYCI